MDKRLDYPVQRHLRELLSYDGVIKDITERKLAEVALSIANKELVFKTKRKKKCSRADYCQ